MSQLRLSREISQLRSRWGGQRGYTLLELLVAMTILAIVLIIVVGSFVSVSRSSTKTTGQRSVQQDARFNLEQIVREARSSAIDYAFYKNTGDPRCAIDQTNGSGVLALLNTQGDANNAPVVSRIYYYYATDPANAARRSLYQYTLSDTTLTPSCNDIFNTGAPNHTRLTANNLNVTAIRFYISPSVDPYDNTLTSQAARLSRNVHPRVTAVMTIQDATRGISGQSIRQTTAITIQTTVSVRAYPFSAVYGQPGTTPVPLPSITPGVGGGLQGDYYRGNNFDTYVATFYDDQIGNSLGGTVRTGAGPGSYSYTTNASSWTDFLPTLRYRTAQSPPSQPGGAENASVRWTGQFNAQSGGQYTFCVNVDNSARVKVQRTPGQPLETIIDYWPVNPANLAEQCATVNMSNGWHDLVVEYNNQSSGGEGSASLQLGLKNSGITTQIPPALLRHTKLFWSTNGRNFTNCTLPSGRPPTFDCFADPDGLTYGFTAAPPSVATPGSLTYTTTSLLPGAYNLALTYKQMICSCNNLDVQTSPAYSYRVRVTLNGAILGIYNLPIDRPGSSPRTFKIPNVVLPAGTSTIRLEWLNDAVGPGFDNNFGVTRLDLTQ